MRYTWAKRNDIEYEISTPSDNATQTGNYAIFDHMKNCVGFVRSEREAALLSLAPELLDALKLAVQYVGRGVVEGAYNNCVVSGEKALDKIEETIRKAEATP